MIPGIPLKQHRPGWQKQMAEAISDPAELLGILNIDRSQIDVDLKPASFRLKVPLPFVERMQKGNPADPLLRQVLSSQAEHVPHPGYLKDPVGDLDAMASPGLIQKYAGRALLVVTGACAVHCRYCFRRHFPYGDANLSTEHWQQALEYLETHTDLREIILSGGDPLSLPDHRLSEMLAELDALPHLKRLRIHTRLPVVIPERVTADLAAMLTSSTMRTSVVVHINHPQEIDRPLARAMTVLREADVDLLNQTVLLNGVNDSSQIQIQLAENLYEAGVLPYYLHLLDAVEGGAHFDLEESRAMAIVEGMRKSLPGYLVPRLVRETAGEAFKTPIL